MLASYLTYPIEGETAVLSTDQIIKICQIGTIKCHVSGRTQLKENENNEVRNTQYNDKGEQGKGGRNKKRTHNPSGLVFRRCRIST